MITLMDQDSNFRCIKNLPSLRANHHSMKTFTAHTVNPEAVNPDDTTEDGKHYSFNTQQP